MARAQSTASKLASLHAALKAAGADGFLVPVADEFLGEYVPASAQRLAWLADFTGSAGMAAVLENDAALFVDGRYTLQAAREVDESLYTVLNSADRRPEAWLAEHLPQGGTLAIDPWLHSMREVERLEKALGARGVRIAFLTPNPIDALWHERPAPPASEARIHALNFSGKTQEEKRAQVAESIRKAGAEVAVLAATDSVNWLLNLRGRDVPHSPLLLAYALLEASGKAVLYIDPARIGPAVMAYLVPGVEVRPPARLEKDMHELGARHAKVLLDAALTPAWFGRALKEAGAEIVAGDDPCQHPKAVKNAIELSGMRAAHLRDGLALTRFLCWLERETSRNELTEMAAAAKLLSFRAEAPEFISPSFETIPGSGPNGAIVHYRAVPETNRVLHQGDLFLLDSGGQYEDGTTDVTRTVAVGEVDERQRRHFTLVLKGHIALATTRFPSGTSGSQLDALARHALWQEGLDYDHGTGHGVGCFLNVHEGPQRIGKRGGDAPFVPGMIVSNEPGYYREGGYGIRIESLVEVVECGAMESGKAMLGFSTLTCAPIDRRLIDPRLLNVAEKAWLNEYHSWVLSMHGPKLSSEERTWLQLVTGLIL